MKYYMFLVTLFICAMTDILTYRIKNIILFVSAAGLLISDLLTSNSDLISDITAAGIVLLILYPFYMLGLLGSGDVKLLALTAMYTGLYSMCKIAAAGAAVSMVIALSLCTIRREKLIKIKYPFAFSLFMGAFPFWFNLF